MQQEAPTITLCRTKHLRFSVVLLVLWSGLAAAAQQDPFPSEVPKDFKVDMETAAHLRRELLAESVAATGPYITGRLVFDRLAAQAKPPRGLSLNWQLRIIENGLSNAYSSPDGTVYIENGLARIVGASSGLWAAVLSHEIAHIMRRDWARRYLYQKSLQNSGAAGIVLGDPSLPSSDWMDTNKASQEMALFCRRLEVEADREGLMLMVRAGYHPDFVPALHHLLHAQTLDSAPASLYAMHPCWEERDRELSRAYSDASIEFEHRWPEWYSSPGGNPPVVVFADAPTMHKTASKQWEIQIPIRCQNLAGAVEVVLHTRRDPEKVSPVVQVSAADGREADLELRQLTGCTSPKTTLTFDVGDVSTSQRSHTRWTDVYVLDFRGKVLARADLPRWKH